MKKDDLNKRMIAMLWALENIAEEDGSIGDPDSIDIRVDNGLRRIESGGFLIEGWATEDLKGDIKDESIKKILNKISQS